MPVIRQIIICRLAEIMKEKESIAFDEAVNILILENPYPTRRKVAEIIGDLIEAGAFAMKGNDIIRGEKWKGLKI